MQGKPNFRVNCPEEKPACSEWDLMKKTFAQSEESADLVMQESKSDNEDWHITVPMLTRSFQSETDSTVLFIWSARFDAFSACASGRTRPS